MKYLLITPWCPYPEHKNGGVHTINKLIHNRPSNIEMDFMYYMERDIIGELAFKNISIGTIFLPIVRKRNFGTRIKGMIQKIPDLISEIKYKKIDEYVDIQKYDVIILDQLLSLKFISYINTNSFVIAMMHDNLPMLYERKIKIANNYLLKIYNYLQKKYLLNYEKQYYQRVNRIVYVSKHDASIANLVHKNKFDIVSMKLGVDIPEDNRISDKEENSIVFSGVMDYGPNEDAACFLISEVYPKLKKIYPDFKLCIAGKNPTDKIKGLSKGKDIIITGFVEDMISTITKYMLYVSPLRYGSGVKNKILEAMASEMPVLASEVSIEGIDGLIDGVNCIFVQENDWVEKICEAINNSNLTRNVAINGKKHVEKNYTWRNSFEKFLIEDK